MKNIFKEHCVILKNSETKLINNAYNLDTKSSIHSENYSM
jgi:hypothetical protein